jgi:HSP20 family protein
MAEQTLVNAPATTEQVSEAPTFPPPTDIYETKSAFIIVLEVPGADPESLNVTVDNGTLTVFAHSTPTAPEGYTLAYAEYRDGNYQRAFKLPQGVDTEQVDAVFKDGILRLTLPKTAPPSKKIPVKTA